MGTNGIGCTEWERDYNPINEQPYARSVDYSPWDIGHAHVRAYHLFLRSVGLGPLATNWPCARYLDGEGEERLGAS